MRLIDFYLRFYLTIFFSILPLYIYNDKSIELIKAKRDIDNMGIDIYSIGLKLNEVIYNIQIGF